MSASTILIRTPNINISQKSAQWKPCHFMRTGGCGKANGQFLKLNNFFPHATLKDFLHAGDDFYSLWSGNWSHKKKKMPYLTPLFASFLSWRSGFNAGPVLVRFEVKDLTLGSFFSQYFFNNQKFSTNVPYSHFSSYKWGRRWRRWLRHCATGQKVEGLLPDVVTGIFHWLNPSGRTVALVSAQLVTEMSTRIIT
jgi:hypothetical protein